MRGGSIDWSEMERTSREANQRHEKLLGGRENRFQRNEQRKNLGYFSFTKKSSGATITATFSQKYRRYRYRYCKSSAATVAVTWRYRY